MLLGVIDVLYDLLEENEVIVKEALWALSNLTIDTVEIINKIEQKGIFIKIFVTAIAIFPVL